MNTVDIIENYFGEDFCLAFAETIRDAPGEHIGPLVERLAEYYGGWLNAAQATAASGSDQEAALSYRIDPFVEPWDWQETVARYKKFLLYFQRFVMPDPLAELFYPAIALGALPWDIRTQRHFGEAIVLLAELAPAIRIGDLTLMPYPFVAFDESIQDGAQRELEAAGKNREYMAAVRAVALDGLTDREFARHLADLKAVQTGGNPPDFLPEAEQVIQASSDTEGAVAYWIVEQMKISGHICAQLGYTPVAMSHALAETLWQEYAHCLDLQRKPREEDKVLQVLVRYDVPGVASASVETILKIRSNDDTFRKFRAAFADVVVTASGQARDDESQFAVEFERAADNLLRPRLEDIRRTLSTPFFEKTLLPGGLSLGAAAIAVAVGANPAGALISASLSPLVWPLLKVQKRWSASGRKAAILRDGYGLLLDKN